MKKTLPLLLIGYISIIGGFNCASAQKFESNFKLKSTDFERMEQAPPGTETTLSVVLTSVNKKALSDFKKSFKAAEQESWFETIEGGLMVKFSKDNIDTRVYYSKKGRRLATIRDFSEENLPKDIRHIVRSKYYDQSIYRVSEVTVDSQMAYLIILEDKTSWKKIRVIDGEIIEDANYQKG